jgi:hypothetical protein
MRIEVDACRRSPCAYLKLDFLVVYFAMGISANFRPQRSSGIKFANKPIACSKNETNDDRYVEKANSATRGGWEYVGNQMTLAVPLSDLEDREQIEPV